MNNLPPLKFKNGKFKIMLVGDLHEKYDVRSDEAKRKVADTTKLLVRAVRELEPDLVVYLGDNASADNEENMRSVIGRITYPASVCDVPMAIVFGNHDRECGVPLEKQLEIYSQEYEKFYTYDADPELTGCGNCNVTVKNSNGDKDILNLWFVDSNNLCEDRSLSYYDWVHEDQIQWYKDTAAKLKEKNGGKVLPALWFMHIPVCEEYELLRKAKVYELPDSVKGHGDWSKNNYVLKEGVEGYLGEGPACSDVNSGVFEAGDRRQAGHHDRQAVRGILRLSRAGADGELPGLHHADLRRLRRLQLYGHRHCPALWLPAGGQLPPALSGNGDSGLLAALAHLFDQLVHRVPVLPPGGQPEGNVPALC